MNASGSDDVLDEGRYSIDTKVDQAYLNISGFTSKYYDTTYDFNVQWTLIQLNSDVLDIVGRPHGGGQVEIEFQKQ